MAGRVPRVEIGTAVLLPALRNPVLLAHQVATLDQVSEGRLILGVGFRVGPAEHPRGIRRRRRAVRKAARTDDGGAAAVQGPVDRRPRLTGTGAGRLPAACWRRRRYRPGGPPLWIGGNLPASLERAGSWFDGWFPNAPDHAGYAAHWAQIRAVAQGKGRDPAALTGAIYLTVSLDEDAARADERLNAFLEGYYGQPAEVLRRRQVCYAGPAAGVAVWLAGYAQAGASHLVLRFAGEHERHLGALAKVRESLGW